MKYLPVEIRSCFIDSYSTKTKIPFLSCNVYVDNMLFDTKIVILYPPQRTIGLVDANTNANVSLLQMCHAVALF